MRSKYSILTEHRRSIKNRLADISVILANCGEAWFVAECVECLGTSPNLSKPYFGFEAFEIIKLHKHLVIVEGIFDDDQMSMDMATMDASDQEYFDAVMARDD